MPYPEAFERQLETVQARMAGGIPDTLILTEHDPVYTIGARKGADQHLVWHEEKLREAGIAVVKTNRGGDITYHGPGQLVGYPILDLRGIRDLHRYLRELEEVLIAAVGSFGIAAHRRPGMTGIWADTRKLAAIGVAVKQWVTYHGFALNIAPDLRHFQGIVPCGITEGSVTSIEQELGVAPPLAEVARQVENAFWERFPLTPNK
jgi:lipoate-protein ligase B